VTGKVNYWLLRVRARLHGSLAAIQIEVRRRGRRTSKSGSQCAGYNVTARLWPSQYVYIVRRFGGCAEWDGDRLCPFDMHVPATFVATHSDGTGKRRDRGVEELKAPRSVDPATATTRGSAGLDPTLLFTPTRVRPSASAER
jgi:hypothetical protein